jgi:hypothetical protein
LGIPNSKWTSPSRRGLPDFDQVKLDTLFFSGPGGPLIEMSKMQPRGPIQPGHATLRTDHFASPSVSTTLTEGFDYVDIDAARCRATFSWSHIQTDDPGGVDPNTSHRSTATVSTVDGWIIDYRDEATFTTVIKRITPVPCNDDHSARRP